jgi:hypothetical protein
MLMSDEFVVHAARIVGERSAVSSAPPVQRMHAASVLLIVRSEIAAALPRDRLGSPPDSLAFFCICHRCGAAYSMVSL